MESKKEALAVLRISEESFNGKECVELAYQKMVRRYPPNLFPDKFRQIRAAYDLLANTNDYWQHFIKSETQDLTFLASFIPRSAETDGMFVSQNDLDERLLSQALLRFVIKRSEQNSNIEF